MGSSAESAAAAPALPDPADLRRRRRILWEIGIVLALSLGKSAVFSLLSLADAALSPAGIRGSSVTVNSAYAQNPLIDALTQLASILFSLAPVALVVFLLSAEGEGPRSALHRLGLRAPWLTLRESAWGLGLFLAVGLGTVGLYLAGRTLGLTAALDPSTLEPTPVNMALLGLSALRHGILEEVLMIGYLFFRGRHLGLTGWQIALCSAVLRGLYHSYQGVGPILGNIAMGLVFAWLYTEKRRLAPLILAHFLLDLTAFWAADWYARLG